MSATTSQTGSSRIFFMIFLAALIEGFDLQAAGVAAPKLAPVFGLTPAQMGLFFSSATFGLIFGAIFGGIVADRMGRRFGLCLSLLVFGVFSIATATVTSVEWLIVMRALTGIGLGGAFPNLVSIAAEATTPEWRGRAVSLMYAGVPLGGAVVSLLAMAGLHDDWRSIFIAGGVAPLLLVGPLMLLLPKLEVDKSHKTSDKGVWQQVFAPGTITRSVLLWVGFFFGIVVLYLLLNWLPTLLVTRGLDRSQAGLIQLIFNIAGAVGGLLGGYFLDGERKVLNGTVCFALLVGSLVLLGIAPPSLTMNAIAAGLVGVSVMAAQSLLYGIAPQCYDTAVRGTGVGLAVAVGRAGSVIGPLLAGGLVAAGRSPGEVLMAIVPVALISGIATVILLSRLRKAPLSAPVKGAPILAKG
ncbi:3-(3-hydroxy-phenyl)propionate transporter MhpT [Rhizobium sp.]|uniref:3-(3-hydroxy-phenyl)propionate transporter MhpT n=1 Tax=Rhizobium sp. TaxID=391 RepID=UPI002AA8A0E0